MVSDEKSGDEFFSLSHYLTKFLQDPLFFCNLNIICLGFLFLNPASCFLSYNLVSAITFWRLLTTITSNISSAPFSFFSFWYPSFICYTFGYCPIILGYSVLFLSFFSFFFLYTSFVKFLFTYLQNYWLFPQLCCIICGAHPRHSSLLLLCFYFYHFFLFISFSFHFFVCTLALLSRILSTFLLESLIY